MIEDTLIFIKYLLFKIINSHVYFSHIKQFHKFCEKKIIKNINNEFMVSLIKKYYIIRWTNIFI